MVFLSFKTPILHLDGPDDSSELEAVEPAPRKRRHFGTLGFSEAMVNGFASQKPSTETV
jgi:hypothetical protein